MFHQKPEPPTHIPYTAKARISRAMRFRLRAVFVSRLQDDKSVQASTNGGLTAWNVTCAQRGPSKPDFLINAPTPPQCLTMDQLPHNNTLVPYLRWHVFLWLQSLRTSMFNRLPLGFPFSDTVIRETFDVIPDFSPFPQSCRVVFRYGGRKPSWSAFWIITFEHARLAEFIIPDKFFDDPMLPFVIDADLVLRAMAESVVYHVDTAAVLYAHLKVVETPSPSGVQYAKQRFYLRALSDGRRLEPHRLAARWMQRCINCHEYVPRLGPNPCCAYQPTVY
ncbi:hypothetical protein C8R43DRAFT_975675 [Mycena crocata]|nr:hypothetical protein C8R43DRAFT_975675 [Mycena crocata]